MMAASLSMATPLHGNALRGLAARLAAVAVPPRVRVVASVGSAALSVPSGREKLPSGVRRAAEMALLAGRPLVFRRHGLPFIAGAVDEPCPALLVAWGGPEIAPPTLLQTVLQLEEELAAGGLAEAVADDPFLLVEAAVPSLARSIGDLRRIAKAPLSLLLLGPTGAGKEVLARAVHAASRRPGLFVAENCAAIPEALVESELFGVRRGAFTGAGSDRDGRLLEAQRGTLFLDEVGDLPLASQSKLLRVLQEREVRPLGATRPLPIDVRVLAATHSDLHRHVREGRFRSDLYFRLAGAIVEIPPLSARLTDLPYLVATLLARLARDGFGPGRRLSRDAFRALESQPLPGNVRELDNLLRRASSLASGPQIEVADLRLPDPPRRQANLEVAAIREALERSRGVKTDAARRLGWTRQKLYRRLTALGLDGSGRWNSG